MRRRSSAGGARCPASQERGSTLVLLRTNHSSSRWRPRLRLHPPRLRQTTAMYRFMHSVMTIPPTCRLRSQSQRAQMDRRMLQCLGYEPRLGGWLGLSPPSRDKQDASSNQRVESPRAEARRGQRRRLSAFHVRSYSRDCVLRTGAPSSKA